MKKGILRIALLVFSTVMPGLSAAQELRTGLSYEYEVWKDLEAGTILEMRHQQAFDIHPDEVLFSLSTQYRISKQWKLGIQARWKTETKQGAEGLSLMQDKNRYTMDAYYRSKVRSGGSALQVRIRYQISQDEDKSEDYYRLRLKWEQRSIGGLSPFLSTEAIFADLHPLPDACRIRTGLEIDLGRHTSLGVFYQMEIMLKDREELMNYALGTRLSFSR